GEAPDGSRFGSMTVRETPVRTMLAPRASANPYKRSIHQSVSLRASHGEARAASTAAGMSVPVCGMHSSRGAEPRRTVSHGAEDSSIIGAEPPAAAGCRPIINNVSHVEPVV